MFFLLTFDAFNASGPLSLAYCVGASFQHLKSFRMVHDFVDCMMIMPEGYIKRLTQGTTNFILIKNYFISFISLLAFNMKFRT